MGDLFERARAARAQEEVREREEAQQSRVRLEVAVVQFVRKTLQLDADVSVTVSEGNGDGELFIVIVQGHQFMVAVYQWDGWDSTLQAGLALVDDPQQRRINSLEDLGRALDGIDIDIDYRRKMARRR